jgi:hypothetical protein
LQTIARRCAYTQGVVTALAALFAVYLAVATREDVRATGAPSLEGATVTGFVYFATCAAALAATLVIAARRTYRGDAGPWRWLSIACETVAAAWLSFVATRGLPDPQGAVFWLVAVLLTAGAVSGLVRKRASLSRTGSH